MEPRATGIDDREEGDLRAGRQAHLDIEELSLWLRKARDLPAAQWSLRFRDEGDASGEIFKSNELRVGGEALRCRPDLVFEDRSADLVLIVERKTTHVPCAKIPVGGYLNNVAQLWCYSWIDDWRDASEVILVSEYWTRPQAGDWGFQSGARKRRCGGGVTGTDSERSPSTSLSMAEKWGSGSRQCSMMSRHFPKSATVSRRETRCRGAPSAALGRRSRR